MLIHIFFERVNVQKQVDCFSRKYKNKKILLYGAGTFFERFVEKCDLSGLNVVGITDKKFKNDCPETFRGFKALSFEEIKDTDFDVIFVTLLSPSIAFEQLKIFQKMKMPKLKIVFLKDNFLNKIAKKLFPKISEDKCIICGGKRLRVQPAGIAPFLVDRMFDFKKNFTEHLHCPDCKFTYFKERPSEEEMARYYNNYACEEYRAHRAKYEPDLYKDSKALICKGVDGDFRKKEIQNNLSLIEDEIPKFKKILDFGGFGDNFPSTFDGSEKYFCDISVEEDVENPRCVSDIDKLERESFDFVMSTHVFEHLSDPKGYVEKIISVIKKGGYLYLELPDESRFYNDFFKDLYVMHEHVNIFTPKALKIMLKDFGCDVLASKEKKCEFFLGQDGYIWCLAKIK